MTIFIDTSFIIALINERDQYHTQALDLSDRYIDQTLAITDAVLLEIANSLARRYKNEAIEVIEQFLDSEDVEVIRLTPEIFDRAFELYKTRPDKEWGLVDCVSFIVIFKKFSPSINILPKQDSESFEAIALSMS